VLGRQTRYTLNLDKVYEASYWMSVDRYFPKEIEQQKQIVGPSPEGNKNKLQKGIMGSLFG
jgi:hypothetical protein